MKSQEVSRRVGEGRLGRQTKPYGVNQEGAGNLDSLPGLRGCSPDLLNPLRVGWVGKESHESAKHSPHLE